MHYLSFLKIVCSSHPPHYSCRTMLTILSGRSSTYTLPPSALCECPFTSSLHISLRHSPYHTSSNIALYLLDAHQRPASASSHTRDPSAVLPLFPIPLFPASIEEIVSVWTVQVPFDSETRQRWWTCRGSRWQIRGYLTCRRVDFVRQGLG